MTLNDYLKKLESRDQRKILLRLSKLATESSITQQMIQNLYNESRLKKDEWHELAIALINASPGNMETERTIREFCRSGRCLKGVSAKIEKNVVLGRVISLEQFCEMLVKLKYQVDIDEAKAYIRSLFDVPPLKMPDEWKKRKIGRFLMWSTFHPDGKGPFVSLSPSILKICCVLGLSPSSGPVILFEYKLPVRIKALIPTFCDAYASDIWSRYFRPAPPSARYGLTMPTDTCPIQQGRPEVVHEVIQAKNLVTPLRYVA